MHQSEQRTTFQSRIRQDFTLRFWSTINRSVALECRVVLADRHQITLALQLNALAHLIDRRLNLGSCYLEHFNNIRLLAQHEAACLVSNVGQLPPLLQVLLVPLVSMRDLGLLPMTL
jgi:hypothetical protein